jgi:hypothetical protein
MGADAPIPRKRMNAAAPKRGFLCGGSIWSEYRVIQSFLAGINSPCPAATPIRGGSAHKYIAFNDNPPAFLNNEIVTPLVIPQQQ